VLLTVTGLLGRETGLVLACVSRTMNLLTAPVSKTPCNRRARVGQMKGLAGVRYEHTCCKVVLHVKHSCLYKFALARAYLFASSSSWAAHRVPAVFLCCFFANVHGVEVWTCPATDPCLAPSTSSLLCVDHVPI